MDAGTLRRYFKGKLTTVLVVSVAVGVLVLLQALRQEPVKGFEERVLVARRELPAGSRIDLGDFEAYPVSQISPLPRSGAAVNDQQLHLLGGLRVQNVVRRHGLLLWSELEAIRPPQTPKVRRTAKKIEVIEEQ